MSEACRGSARAAPGFRLQCDFPLLPPEPGAGVRCAAVLGRAVHRRAKLSAGVCRAVAPASRLLHPPAVFFRPAEPGGGVCCLAPSEGGYFLHCMGCRIILGPAFGSGWGDPFPDQFWLRNCLF